jgi:DNA-directed RNA polymerase I, II, and III subunit RPABC2
MEKPYISDDESENEENEEIEEIEENEENVLKLPKNPKTVKTFDDDEYEEDTDDEDTAADDDAADEEDEDDEDDENENLEIKKSNDLENDLNISDDDDDDEEDDDDENYLQKFNENLKHNIINENHPELQFHNYEEIENLSVIVRDDSGKIIDPLHRTIPFLTKYEKSRILGERANQINSGGKPFIEIESNVIDGYLIALQELKQRKIPFIIKRPLSNGGCEYWKVKDLEMLE